MVHSRISAPSWRQELGGGEQQYSHPNWGLQLVMTTGTQGAHRFTRVCTGLAMKMQEYTVVHMPHVAQGTRGSRMIF